MLPQTELLLLMNSISITLVFESSHWHVKFMFSELNEIFINEC